MRRPPIAVLVRGLLGASAVTVGGCGCPQVPDDLTPADYLVKGSLEGEGGGGGGDAGTGGSGPSEACVALCERSVAWAKYSDAGFREGELVIGDCVDQGDGTVSCSISSDCSAGRRASGHASLATPCSSACDYWRAMADLERAAVIAFEELAATLRHHQAPEALVSRALVAAEDERRHAIAVQRLAGGEGAPVDDAPGHPHDVAPDATARPTPLSLVELARLNAREGCVLESFGAIQVAWQARHVAPGELAETLAQIALDEASHAELAWDIDAWLATVLSAEERGAMERARRAATSALPALQPGAPWLGEVGLGDLRGLRGLRDELAAFVRA